MSRGWPLLRRAPARMLHSGVLAGMILVSVGLLAGLVAAGPLFGAATGAGGLSRRLAAIPDTTAAALRPVVEVTEYDQPPNATRARIGAEVDQIPYLGDPQTSVAGLAWELDDRHPAPFVAVGNRRTASIVYYRTGALAALQIVSGTRGARGLWVPQGVAEDLGLHPGSTVTVGTTLHYNIPSCGSPFSRVFGYVPPDYGQTRVRVAGTYRTAVDGRLPAGAFFSGLADVLPSDPSACPTTAALLIGDQATVDATLTAEHEQPVWTYTDRLTAAGQTPSHLARAAAGAARLRLRSAQPTSATARLLRHDTPDFRIDSGLPAIHAQAAADAVVARDQGRGIAYAGGFLGLAAVVMALRALSQRRRRETELLLGLGTPTRIVLTAGALELLLPTLAGAALGWAGAVLAFARTGPNPQVDPAAVRSAAVGALLVAAITLLCNALVVLAQVRQVSRALSGRAESRLGSQWLPLLTGATAIAVAETLTRARGQSSRDPLGALLPILVLACGCAVITRLVTAAAGGLRQLREPGSGTGPMRDDGAPPATRHPRRDADRLVLRGLRRTGVAVPDLVIVLGIGIGVLAYGLLSAALVHGSVTDKAAVLAGAPSTAHIPHSWQLGGGDGPAPELPTGTAVVWRASGSLTPDNTPYDVLVVNPDALRDAADWGQGAGLAAARAALGAFGEPTPAQVAAGKAAHTPVDALLVGPGTRAVGSSAQVTVGFLTEPIVIRRHLSVFPGAVRPTLVIDARTYFPRLNSSDDPSRRIANGLDFQGDFASWVWTRRPMPALSASLAATGVPAWETLTTAQARNTPALVSSEWAAGYQVVLGLAAAALAGLAVVVAVDRRVARAAPVDLVLSRFGVRPSRLLRLRARELALTCLGALAVLVVPLGVMVALLPRLIEPDPALPPTMPVQVTAGPLLLSALTAVVVTVLAAFVAARRSATLKPGEVLRDDT